MSKVEIYTKAYCPYCTHALALLKQKSVNFEEIKIDGNSALRSAMIERSQGAYTVPQIFINNEHVGGCDQLVALETNSQLDTLLNA
jgi:glutaredoxin 3